MRLFPIFAAAAAAAAGFPAFALAQEEPPAEETGLADAVSSALDEVESGAAEAAEEAVGLPPPLTEEERAQLDQTVERGRQLSAVAQAGILTTRDMLSRIADPEGAGIVGWVAEPEGNAMAVTYYARSEGEEQPVAVYRGRVLGNRVVSREIFLEGERPPLTESQARMAAARAAAGAAGHEPCGEAEFNIIAVPPNGPDSPIHVYALTAPTEPGRFPFGGHYRTIVAPDGETASRSFARECQIVEPSAPEEGERPEPIAITHLLDPMPTEVHVFLARLAGRPLLVATGNPGRVWAVTGETIVELRE